MLRAFLISAACAYAGYYLGFAPLGAGPSLIPTGIALIALFLAVVGLHFFGRRLFGAGEHDFDWNWGTQAPSNVLVGVAAMAAILTVQTFYLFSGNGPQIAKPGSEMFLLAYLGTKAVVMCTLMSMVAIMRMSAKKDLGDPGPRRLYLVR